MDRFDDLSEDFEVRRMIEDLAKMDRTIQRLSDQSRILQSAISQIGTDDLDDAEVGDGAYNYIPIDLNQFFDLMFTLEDILRKDPDYKHTDKPHRPCSFLEVGCGIGRNLQILQATDRFTFDKICGFDLVKEYIEAGQKVFKLGGDLFVQDALTFDYGGFDVIYFYRPFSDDALERQFEDRLVDTMKRGAYIVASLDASLSSSRKLVAKDDSNLIWKRL